jgi:hypothetical protein
MEPRILLGHKRAKDIIGRYCRAEKWFGITLVQELPKTQQLSGKTLVQVWRKTMTPDDISATMTHAVWREERL